MALQENKKRDRSLVVTVFLRRFEGGYFRQILFRQTGIFNSLVLSSIAFHYLV